MKKEDQVTIRLDPLTAPSVKTKDIKRSIAYVARMVLGMENNSKCTITKTNLEEFLENED